MTHLDLHKIYIDDASYHSGHGHAYEFYGVNPAKGATVIVRPDGCKLRRHQIPSSCVLNKRRYLDGLGY